MRKTNNNAAIVLATVACVIAALVTGCKSHEECYERPTLAPLGAVSDPIWKNQEANAEASELVVYQHEFMRDAEWLNHAGEDHVKQIAERMRSEQDLPVVVEQSMTSPLVGAEYPYPVHPNVELDMRRREIVVRSLTALGIPDAEQRVVVAPAFTDGVTGSEAESAYRQGLSGSQTGGWSGGFGGFTFGSGY